MSDERIRCKECGKLLFIVRTVVVGTIEIKCTRCNKIIIYSFSNPK